VEKPAAKLHLSLLRKCPEPVSVVADKLKGAIGNNFPDCAERNTQPIAQPFTARVKDTCLRALWRRRGGTYHDVPKSLYRREQSCDTTWL